MAALEYKDEPPQEHIRNALTLLPQPPYNAFGGHGYEPYVVVPLVDMDAVRARLSKALALLERRVTP